MTSSGEKATRRSFNCSQFVLGALQIRRAVHLVLEGSSIWTLASALILLLRGILPLASLYLMKLIVDSITLGISGANNSANFNQILLLISMAGGIALINALCNSASVIVNEAQAALVSDHIQDLLHAKSIEVDLEYYENPSYYDALHRAQEEAPYRPTRIVNSLAQIFQCSVSLVSMAALLISLSWAVTIALLAAAIPGILIRLKYVGKLYIWQRDATSRERKAWYLHWLLIGDDYAKEIRLFNLGNVFMDRYREIRRQLWRERLDINLRKSTADLSSQAFAVLALFGSFAFIASKAFSGSITIGDLVMYFGAFQQGQLFMQSLFTSLASLYEDNLFLSSLYEFLDLEPRVREPDHPKPVPSPLKSGISFEHVSFEYPGSDRTVLKDVSLDIEAGKVTALVGENGSGKTTLIKLLCRLYDPSSGKITADGIDLRDFRISSLRKEISILFQNYVRYNLTAWENIWLGDVNCPVDMPHVIQAAKDSGADDFINSLRSGYNTVLGRWFDGGAELSTGEWQKMALARVFLRDAQVLILDEPTSSLDPSSEEEIFKRFHELIEGRTAIIISHRLSVTKMADRIYLLKDGHVAERGTHQELVERDEDYARLFKTQAMHYR
jgi:ATP-binding cassette, subfamily B, bacterial